MQLSIYNDVFINIFVLFGAMYSELFVSMNAIQPKVNHGYATKLQI